MTTIILTTIAILIAAAAALSIVFYGGDLYRDGDIGARANSYMNAGVNVAAAVDQFRINERADPSDMDALVQAGYFRDGGQPGEMRLVPGTPGRVTIAGVPADVCARINETLRRASVDDVDGRVASDPGSVAMQGCTLSGGTGTYYATI